MKRISAADAVSEQLPFRRANRWIARFAWLTAAATLFLISSGGMVTSKGVGLAVPDWPTTFGYNMFMFPVSRWVGGIFFEHVHRLIASTVGLLTFVLAIWMARIEPRRWLRTVGYAAVGAVIFQGVLGGLRVTLIKDEIGVFHACLAHAFLGVLVIIALAESQTWEQLSLAPTTRGVATILLRFVFVTTVLVYLQLVLGASMRHQHRDLAIPDFPLAYAQAIPDTSAPAIVRINKWRDARALSDVTPAHIWLQMTHRIGAGVLAIGVMTTLAYAIRNARELPHAVTRVCAVWFCLMCTQILLGAWTIWSNKAADLATAHVATGAAMLGIGTALCAMMFQLRANQKPKTPSLKAKQMTVAFT